jgi:hypothetical protein
MQRATKKITIGMAFTPNKQVNIREEAATTTSLLTILFGIAPRERERLQFALIYFGDELFLASAQQWNDLCTYMAAMDTQLHMLQHYVKYFWALVEFRVGELGDELGTVATEVGDGAKVSGGPHPTLWKGVSINVETSLNLESEVKRVHNDVGDIELTTEQIEGKVEQLLNDIGGLKREVLQIVTLCLGY